MTIPKNIHFCGKDYAVIEVDHLVSDDNALGKTSFKKNTIEIEKRLPQQEKYEILIHELLHIAFSHVAWEQLDDKVEENIVKPWSRNIYGILKDNNLLK